MMDRIFYTIAATSAVAAVTLFSIATYQWFKETPHSLQWLIQI